MANCILAWPNYVDPQPSPVITTGQAMTSQDTAAIVTPTVSGGGWNAAYPLNNIRTRFLNEVARSSNALAASTVLAIDFTVARPVNLVALVRHNLSQGATVRIKGGNDATFATNDFDSGAVAVYNAYYEPGSLPFGWSPAVWTGGPTAEDLIGWASPAFYWMASSIYAVRYLQIAITDTANSAGYVQMGRVFAGPAYQPEINMSYGAQLGFEDKSTFEESTAGVRYFDKRPKARAVTFTLADVSEATAMEMILEMQRRMGRTEQLFFAWDPDDTYHRLRRSMLAYLDALDPLTAAYLGRMNAPVKLIEVL